MTNINGPWQWRGRHLIDGAGRTILRSEPSNAMPDELAAIAAVPELLQLIEHAAERKHFPSLARALSNRIREATWLPPVDSGPAGK